MVSKAIKSIFAGLMLALSSMQAEAQDLSQISGVVVQHNKGSQKAVAIFEGHIQELKTMLVKARTLLGKDVTEESIEQARITINPWQGKISGLRKEVEEFSKHGLISAQDATTFLRRFDDLSDMFESAEISFSSMKLAFKK